MNAYFDMREIPGFPGFSPGFFFRLCVRFLVKRVRVPERFTPQGVAERFRHRLEIFVHVLSPPFVA